MSDELLVSLVIIFGLITLLAMYLTIRVGSPHDLKAKQSAQDLQLQDLHDRLDQWGKRDAMRASRERKLQVVENEGQEAAALPDRRNLKLYKAELRKRITGRRK